MWTQMIISLISSEAAYIIKLVLVASACAALPRPERAKFTLSSVLDSVSTALSPLVSGPNKCEALKSLFGLTYEQMAEKNATQVQQALDIDLITKAGNVKFNLTMSKRLSRALDGNKTIVILVHGFLESSEGLMVSGLSPGLLRQQDLKILALDGRRLINLEYFRSTTLARFMGEKLGNFLNEMVVSGKDPSKIILIGHSLGAHIAGIAGKRLTEISGVKVGRILGLDPAAPCFGAVGPLGRLVPGDATLVLAVHTNGGMLGLQEPVGDVDWYPNGGQSQPGCYLSTCSHSRAWELLAESIITPDHFPARKCDSWEIFQAGRCSKNPVAYLALNQGPATPGKYFLATSGSPPYGLGATGSG